MIAATRNAQSGSTMMEVLVSMVISVIGLLGIAGFQLRAFSAENESFQRAQALRNGRLCDGQLLRRELEAAGVRQGHQAIERCGVEGVH